MDGTTLKAGNQFIIKDSEKIFKYHVFKNGEIVTLVNTPGPEFLKLGPSHLKAQALRFKREADGLEQDIFLRDIQPLEQLEGAG